MVLPPNLTLSQSFSITLARIISNFSLMLSEGLRAIPNTDSYPYNQPTLTIEEILISVEELLRIEPILGVPRGGLILRLIESL